jgi:hypothetical protein
MLANDRAARTFRVPIRLASQLALAMCLAAWPLVAQAAVIFVKPTGDDTHDGLTWDTAKKSVTAGLSAAAAGDQIWVAAGSYFERITLKLSVALYGGFAGGEDPNSFDLADRDFAAHKTILDGSKLGSVVTGPPGATGTCRIDGFTITHGLANYGGGLNLSNNSSPTIANNTVTSNESRSSGGGLYIDGSSPTIIANIITANRASGGFGGGGLHLRSSSSNIIGNTISNNIAQQPPYYSSNGGGLLLQSSNPTLLNNVIANNIADGGGGVFVLEGSTIVANCTIKGNSASSGGGFYVYTASAVIANNLIRANSSASSGGAILALGAKQTIVNNTIVSNIAATGPVYGGAGMRLVGGSSAVVNTIVTFNTSGIVVSGGATLKCNCVFGNTEYNYREIADPTGTDGNISIDPLFVDRPDGDFTLLPTSPCLDAGSNPDANGASDLDGYPRIADGNEDGSAVVEIGAYEYHSYWYGDLNCDDVVGPLDVDPFVLALIDPAAYAAAYPDCDIRSADCNSDGVVNVFDIDPFLKFLTDR